MGESKIILTESDLASPKVEERLKQQSALESAQASYRETASRPSRLPVPSDEHGSFFYNTIVYMAIFGFLGGILAFGLQETIKYFNPDLRAQAVDLLNTRKDFILAFERRQITQDMERLDLQSLDEDGRNNRYYRLYTDPSLTKDQREDQLAEQRRKDGTMEAFADVLSYCACGIMMAIALGMADSLSTRNWRGALVYGSVGAALGLIGGIIAYFLGKAVYIAILGAAPAGEAPLGRVILARSMGWGILGIFFSAAPGMVMRNGRKLLFGILGGLIGGILGGALFDPINRIIGAYPGHLDWVGRVVGITAIGVISGLGTGIIENVAKLGWLKVVEGLIAGKQFILYRNPSFIGSSPQCEIYLFKDNQVLRRHAALHMVPGAYEIEDLGTHATLVNGRAVARMRLHSGDRIQIGRTGFIFHEKQRAIE